MIRVLCIFNDILFKNIYITAPQNAAAPLKRRMWPASRAEVEGPFGCSQGRKGEGEHVGFGPSARWSLGGNMVTEQTEKANQKKNIAQRRNMQYALRMAPISRKTKIDQPSPAESAGNLVRIDLGPENSPARDGIVSEVRRSFSVSCPPCRAFRGRRGVRFGRRFTRKPSGGRLATIGLLSEGFEVGHAFPRWKVGHHFG